jgi:hypothetical protein
VTEAKRADCDSAWYKSCQYNYGTDGNYLYYFSNDLLGQRIPITQQQYADKNLTTPN